MLEQVEAGQRAQDLKMDILRAIRFILQSWDDVTEETISNCWRHTSILPTIFDAELRNLSHNIHDDTALEDLENALVALNLPNPMQAEEFLNMPEEDIVYENIDDDQLIATLVDIFQKGPDDGTTLDPEEADDSTEVPVVSASMASKSLEVVRIFLLQQEGAAEHIKVMNKIEKFIKEKQTSMSRQTTLEEFFKK